MRQIIKYDHTYSFAVRIFTQSNTHKKIFEAEYEIYTQHEQNALVDKPLVQCFI